jgi:hypothetical protein
MEQYPPALLPWLFCSRLAAFSHDLPFLLDELRDFLMAVAFRSSFVGPTLFSLRVASLCGSEKALDEARAGSSNLRFRDKRASSRFRFQAGVSGHHIHAPSIQNSSTSSPYAEIKPYQVRQVLDLVDRYNLKLEAKP